MKNKKLISIISPCFNEQENIAELYERVKLVMDSFSNYDFEYIFIDNASSDETVNKLREIARSDTRVKIIVNTRNFGHIRSPYWGIINTSGAATIYLASDLQDPPELISRFIDEWEKGSKIVLAVKPTTATNPIMHYFRKLYYKLLSEIAEIPIVKDATGFGIYDKEVIDLIREINDPYPYLRGLICELGYDIKLIQFNQPRRMRGVSKNNFYSLFDIAMLGIISHSMVPIRIASMFGFALSILSVFSAIILLLTKILFWDFIPLGYAPFGIFLFVILGILLFFIGILGEYIGVIHTKLQNRPIVVERERVNFSKKS